MIRDIVENINGKLDYSFQDVLRGIVYPLNKKGQRVPASQEGKEYKDAIPNSKKKSIVYWEDYGGTIVDSCIHYQRITQRVRLIIWMNFDKIEQPYDDCVKEVTKSIPNRMGNTIIKLSETIPKSVEVFGRYDYPDRKHYVTLPYDVAVFLYNITYMKRPC